MRNLKFLLLLALPFLASSPVFTEEWVANGDDLSSVETMLLRQQLARDGSELSGQRMASDDLMLGMETPLYIDGDPVFQNWVASVEPVQSIIFDNPDADVENLSSQIRSIGGNRVRPGQLTQVTALLLRNRRPVCSATAISRRHFLTAAHCFCGSQQPTRIAFGDQTASGFIRSFESNFRLVEGAQDMDCSSYASMRRTIAGSDLAVIELDQAVGELYLSAPAELPTSADIAGLEPGTIAIIAGYGRRSSNPQSRLYRIGVKNYILSPIVDVTCVGVRYDCVEGQEIVSRDIRQGGVGPCTGDSGGALFVETERESRRVFVLVAVVSRMARSDFRCGDAVAFTLLSPENLSQVENLLNR